MRSGKPCIRGLRITVYDILEYLTSGMSNQEIIADFPDLAPEDIHAALAFTADCERRLFSPPVRGCSSTKIFHFASFVSWPTSIRIRRTFATWDEWAALPGADGRQINEIQGSYSTR